MGDSDLVKNIDDLKEILGIVTEKVPGLLRGLRDVLYSKDAAANMADAVATFYTKLVEAGIAKEQAMDMTRGYMINLRDIFGGKDGFNVNIGGSDDRRRDD
ncbi:MAG: hypothetical protein E4H08_00895 [Candidatus Atribacteria bacterium]|nr:MAG: hypothetical protein E4H08_00895 [Candidatus Atribacteria bacterium]